MANVDQSALKAFTRSHLRDLWENREDANMFGDEDSLLIKAMSQHAEYSHIWEQADKLSDDEIEKDGTNPILHIQLHAVVENQIAQKNPKEVGQVVKVLMGKKNSRHEAIHAVMGVLAEEVFGILQDKRSHNKEGYQKKLHKLVR